MRRLFVNNPAKGQSKAFAIGVYYPDSLNGTDLDHIVQYCYMGFMTMVSPGMAADRSFLFLWECAREAVVFRIEGLFEPDPYGYLAKLDWHGFSVVFQLELPGYTVDVTNKLLDMWGVDIVTVFESAKKNTRAKYTPALVSGQEQEDTLSLKNGKKAAVHMLYELDGDENSGEGLRCILYDWLLKDLAEKIGSFYILPVAVGSALFLAESGMVLKEDQLLQGLILHGKELSPEFRVPAVVLKYDAGKKPLSILSDTKKTGRSV